MNKNWFFTYWRPAMGWLYGLICLWDFLIAQVLFTVLNKGYVPWEPLTLKGGGMFHLAMLSIVTATAYGRTQEKIKELEVQTNPTPGTVTSGTAGPNSTP